MPRVRWSKRALGDVSAIRQRFTNKKRAKTTGVRLFEIATHLEQHPELGRAGVVAGTRELVVGGTPYIVVYVVDDARSEVVVVCVVDGRSDWK